MRTTLSIDDDVLAAVAVIAEVQRRSVGEVISELARNSLRRPQRGGERNGIPLLTSRTDGPVVTLEVVNALRDEAH